MDKKHILYALAGDGMGHAIRSSVIIDHLLKQKCKVIILTSGRAFDFLNKRYDHVYNIHGINYVYENEGVNDLKTFINFTKNVPNYLKKNIITIFRLIEDFKPNLIISDFEFFSSLISRIMNIPLISIDNMHIINKCRIKVPTKYLEAQIRSYGVIRFFMLHPKEYLITTYFYPPVRNKKRVKLFPPILRKEISKLNPKVGNHILVYQTSSSNKRIIDMIKKIDEKFVVYGFDLEKKDKNLEFKKFNEDVFFKDLESCKAVITNGGFTLIGEALHLRKPILSIPMKFHFEQTLNAVYLQRLGYGKFCEKISKKCIEDFLSNLDEYRMRLKYYKPQDNHKILEEVDRLIKKYPKDYNKRIKINI